MSRMAAQVVPPVGQKIAPAVMAEVPTTPEAQTISKLQEAIQRASVEKTRWESQCDADHAKVESLRQQLEDAHAAVMGYHLDCTNFAGNTRALEAEVAELKQECAMRRAKILASSRHGDMLQDQLEDLRTRCEVLKTCKAEFATSLATGAVADEAMVRYLNFHMQESSTRLSQAAARVASIRSRCKALVGMSEEIVSELKEYQSQREATASGTRDVDLEKLKDLLVAPPTIFGDIPISEHESLMNVPTPAFSFRASSLSSDRSEVSLRPVAQSDLIRAASEVTRSLSNAQVRRSSLNTSPFASLSSCPGSGFASAEDCTAVSDSAPESFPTASPVHTPGPSPDSSMPGSTAGSATAPLHHAEGISGMAGHAVGSGRNPAGNASVPVDFDRSRGRESPFGQHHLGHRMPAPTAAVAMGPLPSPSVTSAGSSSAGSDLEPARSPGHPKYHIPRSWALVNGAQSARVGSSSPTAVLETGLQQRRLTDLSPPGVASHNSAGRSPRMQGRARSPGAAGSGAGGIASSQSRGSAARRSPAGSGSANATSRHLASSRSVSPQQTPSPPQSPSMSHSRMRRRSKPSGVPAHVVMSQLPSTTQSSAQMAAVAVSSTQRPPSAMRGMRCQLEARRQQLCDHICQLQALHTELRYLDNILSTASQAEDSSGADELSYKTATSGERIEASLAPLLSTLGATEPLVDAGSEVSVPALRLACNRLRVLVEPWAGTGSAAGQAPAGGLGAESFRRAAVPSNRFPGVPAATS